tara:strand:+ start:3942 stop:4553 length:612 start_codon:yes stop_codon:yes gene_type:complete
VLNNCFALILSCEKYSFKRERQNIEHLPMNYRYFIGNPDLQDPIEEGKIVYLPCPDDYEYLTKKTLLAFKWIRENVGFVDYVLKTDDDVVFKKEKIIEMVNNLKDNKIDYAGIFHKGGYHSPHHFGKCSDKRLNKILMPVPDVTYCIGGAYWISEKAQKIIGSIKDYKPYSSIFEDACIGNILVSNGIKPVQIDVRSAINWND